MPTDGYNGLSQIQGAHFAPVADVRRWHLPTTSEIAVLRADALFMGIFWVTLATALFAGLAGFARATIAAGLPPTEVAFLRNLCALGFLAPMILRRGRELFATDNLRLYGLRCTVSTISMTAWFCAIGLIPLGEVTAISFLAPLFGTLAAMLILGEVVRARRWTAMCVGFLGAMIILRPGSSVMGMGQVFALISAMLGGFLAIMVKQLTVKDDANRIVCLTTLFMTPLSLIPALFVWQWPSLSMLPYVFGMGLSGVLGHMALTRSFAAMDASLVMTFEFSRMPFICAIAYLAFGETIDAWTWVGALIIFASAVYVTRREAQLRRAKAAAA
jgi:drug/metabolite transporter (DMT)-like permease